MRSICEEESQSSVVGGVNLILAECTTLMFMHAGMLAPDGRCKSLDARADGYVRAENCGVCVFTSHGDDNETLVSGTAINQDGRTSTLTAPNGPSQTQVIASALQYASNVAEDVVALEMHGTGTALGDPIEVGGALGILGCTEGLQMHAMKSCVGHAECAAGVVGLIRASFGLQTLLRNSIMHMCMLNAHVYHAIPRNGPQVYQISVAREVVSLHQGMQARPTCVGVSAFAFQGTNAHAIIKSAPRDSDVMDSLSVCSRKKLLTLAKCWFTSSMHDLASLVHLSTKRQGHTAYIVKWSHVLASYLWDHSIRGRALLPAASHIHLISDGYALFDTDKDMTILDLIIHAPLLIGKTAPTLEICVDVEYGKIRIKSSQSTCCSARWSQLSTQRTRARTHMNNGVLVRDILRPLSRFAGSRAVGSPILFHEMVRSTSGGLVTTDRTVASNFDVCCRKAAYGKEIVKYVYEQKQIGGHTCDLHQVSKLYL